jgi:hypothetical protein
VDVDVVVVEVVVVDDVVVVVVVVVDVDVVVVDDGGTAHTFPQLHAEVPEQHTPPALAQVVVPVHTPV